MAHWLIIVYFFLLFLAQMCTSILKGTLYLHVLLLLLLFSLLVSLTTSQVCTFIQWNKRMEL